MIETGVYTDVIADRQLTGNTKIELAGVPTSTAANDYVLPAASKKLLYFQPYIYSTTPAANDAIVATLKIESDDLGIKDYEVYATPFNGGFTLSTSTITTISGYSPPDLQRTAIYPGMFAALGGEKVQPYGVLQSAPTSSIFMGANLWWSDDPGEGEGIPYRAKVTGTAGTGGSLTATGTATGSVAGANISLAGQPARTIKTLTGVLVGTTPAAGKALVGWFSLTAAEIAYIQRYASEPIFAPDAASGTTATELPYVGKLTRIDNLAVPIQPPSTIASAIFLTAAPTTSGLFGQGILYQ